MVHILTMEFSSILLSQIAQAGWGPVTVKRNKSFLTWTGRRSGCCVLLTEKHLLIMFFYQQHAALRNDVFRVIWPNAIMPFIMPQTFNVSFITPFLSRLFHYWIHDNLFVNMRFQIQYHGSITAFFYTALHLKLYIVLLAFCSGNNLNSFVIKQQTFLSLLRLI